MSISVGSVTPPKLGHKGVERFPESERRRYFDQLERGVVPRDLANDDTFLAKAENVAAAPADERVDVAVAEARAYVRNSRRQRDAIARLLLVAAEKPWERYASRALKPGTMLALRATSCRTLARARLGIPRLATMMPGVCGQGLNVSSRARIGCDAEPPTYASATDATRSSRNRTTTSIAHVAWTSFAGPGVAMLTRYVTRLTPSRVDQLGVRLAVNRRSVR
jgi:hypothetical protein